MFPLKRLPTIGSPMRSFLFIHTLNIISLHDTFMQYIFSFVMIFFSSVNSIISPSTLYWSLSMPYGMKYVVTIERISSFWILLVMDEYKSISSIVRLSIAPSSPSLASAISCFLSFLSESTVFNVLAFFVSLEAKYSHQLIVLRALLPLPLPLCLCMPSLTDNHTHSADKI